MITLRLPQLEFLTIWFALLAMVMINLALNYYLHPTSHPIIHHCLFPIIINSNYLKGLNFMFAHFTFKMLLFLFYLPLLKRICHCHAHRQTVYLCRTVKPTQTLPLREPIIAMAWISYDPI